MTDLTPIFQNLCQKSSQKPNVQSKINKTEETFGNSSEIKSKSNLSYYFDPSHCSDRYLREAYRILGQLEQLKYQLEKFRPAYLNVSRRSKNFRNPVDGEAPVYMSEKERDELDAQAKIILNRGLQAIFNLENIEKERLEAQSRRRPLTTLGRFLPESWMNSKSEDPEWLNETRTAITWFLNKKAMDISELIKHLQHARLSRELDRQEIFSWKNSRQNPQSKPGNSPSPIEGFHLPWNMSESSKASSYAPTSVPEEEEEQLDISQEQLRVLEKENKELLEQFESSLQQIQQAEKSLLEISEMQTTLSTHIELQAREAERLYQDAQSSSEALGQGNQYLKSATTNAAQSRYFLFIFFLVASATLLFLDWYG